MERRRADRITVNLKAERISCTENCSVFIENLSENGIYMISAPAQDSEYVPGKEVDLEFELSTGEVISLKCNVKWSYNGAPEDSTNNVGLEIINPPENYREFIRSFR